MFKNRKWLAFTGIVLLSFAGYLDYTIVNTALPTIQRELHANLISLQWVMNIYFLTLCILATVMGRIGDLYGRRRCFYIGAGIFAIASVVAGLSSNIHWLILGRLLQGVGAAMIFPLGPSLLPQSFPEKERGKAIAWFGSLGGIALALGPVLGGIIVTHWGWRWIFFINIPIILLGFLFCFRSISESNTEHTSASLDIKGMLLLTLTMGGIVLGIINSQNFGWINPYTLMCLVIGVISSIFLVKCEQAQENPLVDFRDFCNLLFFSGAMLCFLGGILTGVALFFDPIYLQVIKGQSAQLSGLILFAIPVTVFIGAFLVSALVSRFGMINTLLLGFLLGGLSILLHVFFNANTTIFYIVLTFACLGGLWTMANTVSIIAAQTAVGHARASVATGSVVTMFSIGGSIGLAIAVVIYNFITSHTLKKMDSANFPYLKELIANPANSLQVSMNDGVHHMFNTVFLNGFVGVMWFLFVVTMMPLLLILVWKKRASRV